MADDPDAARDNVVPLHSKALLPHRIPAGRFADAMRALRDDLRGSLRENGVVARIAHIFERLMWVIAKGDDLKETVFPTATELALALDELDDEIAALRERPAASADPEQAAQLERDLATVRSALDELHVQHRALEAQQRDAAVALEAERVARSADRIAHDGRVAALTRELEAERTARQTAERARLDEFRTAGAALRAEATSAAQAIAALTALAERAGAAHTTVEAVLAAITATAETSSTPNLAATKALLTARRERLERWLRGLEDDFLRVVAEELAEIPDAKELQAMQRTGGVQVPGHIRAEVAAHVIRRQQLEHYSNALIVLKRPVEQERDAISKVLAAIDLVSQPVPAKAELPAIPDYPEPPALADSDDVGATGATPAPAAGESAAAPVPPMLPVQLAVVLYDIVRREIGAERRLILWVGKCAEESGILARHGLTFWPFSKEVLSRDHHALCDQYLKYWGTIGGNKSVTFFMRTEEPVPPEWEVLVTAPERTAFLTAFRAKIAARAAAKGDRG